DHGLRGGALRLRVRWMHALSGRAAWALGERLAASGDLTEPGLIRHMNLEHVEAVATNRAGVVPGLVASHEHHFGAPLPAWFQLSDIGRPIRAQCAAEVGGGTGAGGGVGVGPVTYDIADPPAGSVLGTTTLTPGLGPGHRGHAGPARRLGPGDNDADPGAGAAAVTPERDRGRDRLGPIPSGH